MTVAAGRAAPPATLNADDLPGLFRSADSSSMAGQKMFTRATFAHLLCLLIAAAMAFSPDITITVNGHELHVDGLVAAAAFISAILIYVYILESEADVNWYDGRAAAESAKSLAWRFAVGGEPFGLDSHDDAERELLRALEGTVLDLAEIPLQLPADDSDQITAAMRQLRSKPLPVRQDAYLHGRVQDQRRWYVEKQTWNAKRGDRWARATLAVEAIGGLAAVVQATGVAPHNLLHIAAPLAFALTCWIQTKQFRMLANAYGIAAQELGTIATLVGVVRSEEAWGEFVAQAESAISREHKLWRATRGSRSQHPRPRAAL